MEKTLLILEVSQKQSYIFSRKKLRENVERSAIIQYVTSSAFLRDAAEDLYSEPENLVYAGGGHTVLQFEDERQAVSFASRVTEQAMRRFDGLELFAKKMKYDSSTTPEENLKRLSEELEKKKALRTSSFRRTSFGVEVIDAETLRPEPLWEKENLSFEGILPPDGFSFPTQFEELAGEDNFLAVVHIDGNAMGNRVKNITSDPGQWEDCCKRMRRFSEGVQQDFESALRCVEEALIEQGYTADKMLPIRPVILAGDDVCFVTQGSLGLECARVFLEALSKRINVQDGKAYAACAGVAMVHVKYPFHAAYDLAEELCSNAKRFGAELDPEGRISAMDWHLEFGQLRGHLSDLRRDYRTEDGGQLELRPVVVLEPESCQESTGLRTYAFFRCLCRAMKGEYGKTARGKIKGLRTACKQGELESRFFLHDQQVSELLYHGLDAAYRDEMKRWEKYREALWHGEKLEKEIFHDFGGVKRCLFFDAIELIDHFDVLEVRK